MKAKYCHEDEDGKYMMSYGKKYYLKGGKPIEDVWSDIPTISATSKERTGYPTQKPKALLERILKMSLPIVDGKYTGVVADFFAGSGTTLEVAKELGVSYIGCDKSEVSYNYIINRLNNSKI
jgi:DNA modification methylase